MTSSRSDSQEHILFESGGMPELNSFAVRGVDSARVLMDDAKANSNLALQIEHDGQLQFSTYEIY